MLRVILISTLVASGYAQTCTPDVSTGPCFGAGLPCQNPTDFCDAVSGNCCPITATVATVATVPTGTTIAPIFTAATGVFTVAPGITSSTSCVDRVNPLTGVSDCPSRVSLCNDPTYLALMTQQCPRTCGRCTTASTGTGTCVDLVNAQTGVSDCPSRASLCNDPTYLALMTQQCPRTCGRCSGVSSTISSISGTCVDLVNPTTGVSDCPSRVSLCNDATYLALMTQQCPRTCGRCGASTVATGVTAVTSATTACVDRTNPATGVSDCPASAALCRRAGYVDFMRVQCPLTCGFCSG